MFKLNESQSITGSIIKNFNAKETLNESGFADLKKETKVKPRVTGADKIATGKEENKAKCIKESDAIAEILGKKYNLTEEQSKELSALVEKAFIQPLAEAETGYEGEDKFEWLKHQFENKTWADVNPDAHKVEDIQVGDTNKDGSGEGTTDEPKVEKVDGRETGASDIAKDDAKDKAKCIKESEETPLTEEVIVESELSQVEDAENLSFNNTAAEVLAHIADQVGGDIVIAADYGEGAKLYYKSTEEADFDTAVEIAVEEQQDDEGKPLTILTGETDLTAVIENIRSQVGAGEELPAEPSEEPVEEVPEDLEGEPVEEVPVEEPAEDIEQPEE